MVIRKEQRKRYFYTLAIFILIGGIFFFSLMKEGKSSLVNVPKYKDLYQISYPFFKTVLDVSTFLMGILLAAGSIFYYILSDDDHYAIFGIAFLGVSIFSIFHFLILNQRIIPFLGYPLFVPYSWWLGKMMIGCAFVGGVLLTFLKQIINIRKKQTMLFLFAFFLLSLISISFYFSLFLREVPLVYTPKDRYLSYQELLPVVMYLVLVIPGLCILRKKHPSFFYLGMILGFVFNSLSEIFFILYPEALFSFQLNLGRFLELIMFLPPLIGIVFDNFGFYKTAEASYLDAVKAKEQEKLFVSSMTNILKVPIFRIKGHLHSIMEGADGKLNEPQSVSINHCHQDSLILDGFIHELSELALLENKQIIYRPEKFDFKQAIQALLQGKEDAIHTEFPKEDVYCLLDSQRGHQMIKNLIRITELVCPKNAFTYHLSKQQNQVIWECKGADSSSCMKMESMKLETEPTLEIYLLKKITEKLAEGQNGELSFQVDASIFFSLKLKQEGQ